MNSVMLLSMIHVSYNFFFFFFLSTFTLVTKSNILNINTLKGVAGFTFEFLFTFVLFNVKLPLQQ